MFDYSKKSLEAHKRLGGKIEKKRKAQIKNKEDLSVFYTPGVGAVSSAIARDKKLASTLTFKRNRVAGVSDGSEV